MHAVKWSDVISATHGVFFSSQEQVEAWESVFRKALPDLKIGEIEKALNEAMARGEKKSEYRLTALDVIRWIKMSRNGWKERSYIEDGREYFPDRALICGQVPSRKV